jgi:putative hydrolase of the HAD superfamily
VTALREAGIRTGVISNWDRRLASLIEGLGLGEMFDVVVSSADVGLRKPDPRVFMLACERLGVAPEEAVHVGDHHYADVLGARAVGMTPVLIQRAGSDAMPAMAACATIRTFEELPDVLGLED